MFPCQGSVLGRVGTPFRPRSRPQGRPSARTAARCRAGSTCAQNSMSASSPGGPYVRAFRPSSGSGTRARPVRPPIAASRALAAERGDDPPGAVGVVERERALEPRADDRHVAARRTRAPRRRRSGSAATRAAPSRTAPPRSRIARVPFVVERISVRALGARGELARRGARRRSRRRRPPFRSPPTTASSPSSRAQRPCLVDLGAAEDALVARRERLRDRRGRADHVDDDADGRRGLLGRGEGDMDAHADTLVRVVRARPRYCYRHPDRETGLSCSECGRPDLLRVHDARAGRPALPRALGQAAGDPAGRRRRRSAP